MRGPNGMPLGAQLLARPGEEAKLLAAAEWVMRHGTG
jgi:Asp-tRNA(Asn)/Glu-tRNA(Gln) amidotransferase A subunit family amidase